MHWNQVQASWKQFKGRVKQSWGKLTHNARTTIAGKRERDARLGSGPARDRRGGGAAEHVGLEKTRDALGGGVPEADAATPIDEEDAVALVPAHPVAGTPMSCERGRRLPPPRAALARLARLAAWKP